MISPGKYPFPGLNTIFSAEIPLQGNNLHNSFLKLLFWAPETTFQDLLTPLS
jgi:hypothetical protein